MENSCLKKFKLIKNAKPNKSGKPKNLIIIILTVAKLSNYMHIISEDLLKAISKMVYVG